jgi:glucose/arabinose dehydrogenase
MFPPEYRGRIIIAEHGSWNRTTKSGYRLVSVDPSARPPIPEVFGQGWLQGESFWGRPVDVQVMPDGSLLVSDDVAGALYRITYKG